MGSIGLGVNLEFVRHDDKDFEWGVEMSAGLAIGAGAVIADRPLHVRDLGREPTDCEVGLGLEILPPRSVVIPDGKRQLSTQ